MRDEFRNAFNRGGNGPFLPIVFCLDVSGSMKSRISDLQQGLQQFIQDIKSDKMAIKAAQGAIITFDDNVTVVQDFAPVVDWQIPTLTAGGTTDLIGAVDKALEMLEIQKRKYQSEGCDYIQPWLVILSDGEQYPKDDAGVDRVAAKVSKLIKDQKLVSFNIGIGNKVNSDLGKFSKDQDKYLEMIEGKGFSGFFAFISMSASVTVRSGSPGHQTDIDDMLADAIMESFTVKRY